jgi:hypothetical protein
MEHYDLLCVGGGIAGLYTAYRALKAVPTLRVAVVESSNRWGGRIKVGKWRGVNIVHGAGVARLDKDYLLVSLLADVYLWADPYPMQVNYVGFVPKKPRVIATLKRILKEWVRQQPLVRGTFKDYATSVLGEKSYSELRDAVGYTDYEHADVHDTLFDYGFNDTVSGNTNGIVPWNVLIQRLVTKLKKWGCTMLKNRPVQHVRQEGNMYVADCGPLYPLYSCKKIVLAVTTPHLAPLWKFPIPPPVQYHQDIPTQPFARIYAQIDKRNSTLFQTAIQAYTVVRPPLQKIIPINKKKGIYMVAYADNENARQLRDITLPELQQLLHDTLGIPVVLNHMKIIFWESGTHYYTPLSSKWQSRDEFLNIAQKPMPHVFVVGEGFSRNQGWVQGALESVEAIFSDIIMPSTTLAV